MVKVNFQVCIEILNATFLPPKKVLTKLTSAASFAVASFVSLCLAAFRTFMHIKYSFISPEGESYASSTLFYCTVDIPGMVLMVLIVIFFMVTVRRLKQHNAVLGKMANTNAEKARIIARTKATKRNMKTLVAIFCLTVISFAPREVCLIVIHVSDPSQQLITVLRYMNIFVVLKPVFDPPIFMYRLKAFRQELKSIFVPCVKKNQ